MLPFSYLQSRARFRELGAQLGAELRCFSHDDAADRSGLSTDTAFLGPRDAQTIVVIASGTHGVEGYAGAACQFRFMESYRARFAGSGIAFLLVHAVNPWGFFHDRRVTREGVDLNRNFIDFSAPRGTASAYGAYHALLVSQFRPLPGGLLNELRLLSCGLTRRRRQALQAAVTAGQYDHPEGLFFGGTGPTKSREVWEEILGAYLPSPAGRPSRRNAFLLDLHTGLGRRGAGELISYLPPSSPSFRKMSDWFDGSLKSMADGGDSVSATVEGTLTEAFDRRASEIARQSYAIGLEFGTCSPLAVLNALRYDHWYHNNAALLQESQRERARRKMKEAFSAADAEWLEQVITRFDQVASQLVAGLSKD